MNPHTYLLTAALVLTFSLGVKIKFVMATVQAGYNEVVDGTRQVGDRPVFRLQSSDAAGTRQVARIIDSLEQLGVLDVGRGSCYSLEEITSATTGGSPDRQEVKVSISLIRKSARKQEDIEREPSDTSVTEVTSESPLTSSSGVRYAGKSATDTDGGAIDRSRTNSRDECISTQGARESVGVSDGDKDSEGDGVREAYVNVSNSSGPVASTGVPVSRVKGNSTSNGTGWGTAGEGSIMNDKEDDGPRLSKTQKLVISTCSTVVGLFFIVAVFIRIKNYVKRVREEQAAARRPSFRSTSFSLRTSSQQSNQGSSTKDGRLEAALNKDGLDNVTMVIGAKDDEEDGDTTQKMCSQENRPLLIITAASAPSSPCPQRARTDYQYSNGEDDEAITADETNYRSFSSVSSNSTTRNVNNPAPLPADVAAATMRADQTPPVARGQRRKRVHNNRSYTRVGGGGSTEGRRGRDEPRWGRGGRGDRLYRGVVPASLEEAEDDDDYEEETGEEDDGDDEEDVEDGQQRQQQEEGREEVSDFRSMPPRPPTPPTSANRRYSADRFVIDVPLVDCVNDDSVADASERLLTFADPCTADKDGNIVTAQGDFHPITGAHAPLSLSRATPESGSGLDIDYHEAIGRSRPQASSVPGVSGGDSVLAAIPEGVDDMDGVGFTQSDASLSPKHPSYRYGNQIEYTGVRQYPNVVYVPVDGASQSSGAGRRDYGAPLPSSRLTTPSTRPRYASQGSSDSNPPIVHQVSDDSLLYNESPPLSAGVPSLPPTRRARFGLPTTSSSLEDEEERQQFWLEAEVQQWEEEAENGDDDASPSDACDRFTFPNERFTFREDRLPNIQEDERADHQGSEGGRRRQRLAGGNNSYRVSGRRMEGKTGSLLPRQKQSIRDDAEGAALESGGDDDSDGSLQEMPAPNREPPGGRHGQLNGDIVIDDQTSDSDPVTAHVNLLPPPNSQQQQQSNRNRKKRHRRAQRQSSGWSLLQDPDFEGMEPTYV